MLVVYVLLECNLGRELLGMFASPLTIPETARWKPPKVGDVWIGLSFFKVVHFHAFFFGGWKGACSPHVSHSHHKDCFTCFNVFS